ncbi:hypothetical protein ACFPVX_13085 [Cohnella faecalis]|uniref:WYL domain-containing protein n=1 Tax=Cohnella faecalis TaxID=2315694 RepID=A0A398CPH1_9BACL|nr:hypothetical protein [Cohnella faecalis]RIE04415.1 hypothetical protein D3H35_07465 [Cohnella faecalis]
MSVNMEKLVGRTAEIIYQDSKGAFTKRLVSVFSIRDGKARVLDWNKRAFRTLVVDRILDARPVTRDVS